MSKSIKIKSIRLAHHSRDDRMIISHVEKPYGEYSDPIVKISVRELDKNVGTIEIPYENLDEVIKAMQEARRVCAKIPHEDIHGEINADIGGGGA